MKCFFHTNAQEVKPINLLNPRVCFHRVYRVGMSTAMRCMYTKRAYIQQWGMYTVHRGHVYTIHWHVYCRGTCMPLMSRVFFFGNEGHSAKEALWPHRISLNIDQNTFLKEVTFMDLSCVLNGRVSLHPLSGFQWISSSILLLWNTLILTSQGWIHLQADIQMSTKVAGADQKIYRCLCEG